MIHKLLLKALLLFFFLFLLFLSHMPCIPFPFFSTFLMSDPKFITEPSCLMEKSSIFIVIVHNVNPTYTHKDRQKVDLNSSSQQFTAPTCS